MSFNLYDRRKWLKWDTLMYRIWTVIKAIGFILGIKENSLCTVWKASWKKCGHYLERPITSSHLCPHWSDVAAKKNQMHCNTNTLGIRSRAVKGICVGVLTHHTLEHIAYNQHKGPRVTSVTRSWRLADCYNGSSRLLGTAATGESERLRLHSILWALTDVPEWRFWRRAPV